MPPTVANQDRGPRRRTPHNRRGPGTHRTGVNRMDLTGTGNEHGRPAARRFLDLSTTHLPEHLGSHALSGHDGVVACRLTHGWPMWVPPDPQAHADDYPSLPAEVLRTQRYARARGCDYVLFDADADQVGDLPAWD